MRAVGLLDLQMPLRDGLGAYFWSSLFVVGLLTAILSYFLFSILFWRDLIGLGPQNLWFGGCFGDLLGLFEHLLGSFWRSLGDVWGVLGPSWGALGTFFRHSWGRPGALVRDFAT